MSVASPQFLAFVAIAAVLYNVLSYSLWRGAIMLAANIAFLASFTTNLTAFIPLAVFLLAGYLAIKSVEVSKSERMLAVLAVALIVLFCWLKKYFFLSFLGFMDWAYVTLGLSYIFFRVLALLIDVAHGEVEHPPTALEYLNFTLNFPTLIAGPIQRYQDYAEAERALTWAGAGEACVRITIGFFKVIALSSVIGGLQKSAIALMLEQSTFAGVVAYAVAGIGLYPVFLYYNFSGYTDIVIGVGRFFLRGYPENFNFPFSSKNFLEFWTRWHMSLSNWLRDYLYTPLLFALLRRFDRPGAENYLGPLAFFVTFFVIGIWHGSTIVFAIYGLLLGLGVSANKLYQSIMINRLSRSGYRQLGSNPIYVAAARGLTFTWYAACMLFFWAEAPELRAIGSHVGVAGAIASFAVLFLLSSLALPIVEMVIGMSAPDRLRSVWENAYAKSALAGVLAFFCFVAVLATSTSAPQIIYQAF